MLTADSLKNIEAAVLAGGENRRFEGKVKANMKVGKSSIIEKTLEVLDSVFTTTIISTNYPSEFKDLENYKLIPDVYKKLGPLGGIHAVLTDTGADALFIVASDMPELSAFLIRQMKEYFMIAECEVLIPRFNDKIEPLHGFYRKEILPRLDKYLLSSPDFSIRSFLGEVKVEFLDILEEVDGQSVFTNINDQTELNDYLSNHTSS